MLRRLIGEQVRELPRSSKRLIVAIIDCALSAIAVYLAIYLRIGEFPERSVSLAVATALAILFSCPIFVIFRLYREIFRQSGLFAVAPIARACATYGVLYATVLLLGSIPGVPRTVGIIQPILLFLLVSCSRVYARYWLAAPAKFGRMLPRVLIYGAGSAGRQLCSALERSGEIKVVGYLDDDPSLHGSIMGGHQILNPAKLESIVDRWSVNEILLALPSATQRRRNDIIQALRSIPVHVRTLPGIIDLAHGRINISDLRELDIQDLLGRGAVPPQPELMQRNVANRVVMITGAGGSIGMEICRQVLAVHPRVLVLLEQSEFALYHIHGELLTLPHFDPNHTTIIPLLGSVADADRMRAVLSEYRPDTIYHAAAYKHVPIIESNIAEGVRNNVLGTFTVARLAAEFDVSDFVLISTDKAVRPTNVMGATKRIAELVLQGLHQVQSNTRFSMVRFGNVLGSSGSVVPLFRRQLAAGGPITVTDTRVIRYFMTIPEAAQLVIQAGAMAEGGDVFVLDMGDAVRIVDLARNMIELTGLSVRDDEHPDGDIEIVEIGLRPGEKLFEELLIGETPQPTGHARIMKAHERALPFGQLQLAMKRLSVAVAQDDTFVMIEEILTLVPEYTPDASVRGWDRTRESQLLALPDVRGS
jgi:FlaA1/EpsC-like NDP-sugar epimerase